MLAQNDMQEKSGKDTFSVYWTAYNLEKAQTALKCMRAQVEISASPTSTCSALERQAGLAVCALDAAKRMCIADSFHGGGAQLSMTITVAHMAACELLVMSCSRELYPTLRSKGMPDTLKLRLDQACGLDLLVEATDLWSRLGKAKYEVFTPATKWGGKKRRSQAQSCGGDIPAPEGKSKEGDRP